MTGEWCACVAIYVTKDEHGATRIPFSSLSEKRTMLHSTNNKVLLPGLNQPQKTAEHKKLPKINNSTSRTQDNPTIDARFFTFKIHEPATHTKAVNRL